eukprot:1178628-Prorocentrum_minimum.AAC.2
MVFVHHLICFDGSSFTSNGKVVSRSPVPTFRTYLPSYLPHFVTRTYLPYRFPYLTFLPTSLVALPEHREDVAEPAEGARPRRGGSVASGGGGAAVLCNGRGGHARAAPGGEHHQPAAGVQRIVQELRAEVRGRAGRKGGRRPHGERAFAPSSRRI